MNSKRAFKTRCNINLNLSDYLYNSLECDKKSVVNYLITEFNVLFNGLVK